MGVLAFGFRVSVLSTWYLTSRECTCGVETGRVAASCRNSLETRTFHWPMLPRSVGSLVRYSELQTLSRTCRVSLLWSNLRSENFIVYLEPTPWCGVHMAQGAARATRQSARQRRQSAHPTRQSAHPRVICRSRRP